jgi:hypothetical protein
VSLGAWRSTQIFASRLEIQYSFKSRQSLVPFDSPLLTSRGSAPDLEFTSLCELRLGTQRSSSGAYRKLHSMGGEASNE